LKHRSITAVARSLSLSLLFTTLAALTLSPESLADHHIQLPDTSEGIADKLDELAEQAQHTGNTDFIDQYNEIWDELTPDQQEEVDNIQDAKIDAQAKEGDRFKRELEDLRGDEWAAYTAAYLSSTLFDVDKPFRDALGENLQTLGEQTGQTVPELVGQMNEQVRTEAADAERIRLEAIGDEVLAGYDQATIDIVINPGGFLDYAHSGAVNRSALMIQDAFIGNTLQIRYQLNTLKNATGDIPESNFVTQSGVDVFNTVTDSLHDIGQLETNFGGAMTATIDAKKGDLADFLELPGMEGTPEHFARRNEFIDVLTELAEDTASERSLQIQYDTQWRSQSVALSNWQTSTRIPTTTEGRAAYTAERNGRIAEIAELKTHIDRDYVLALNQSPFLTAPIEVDGFEGPLWEYLSGGVSGGKPTGDTSHRTPGKDQEALDQAINYLDGLTMNVAIEYGSIVDGKIMIRTFGGPSFKALRIELAEQLSPMIPNIGTFLDETESLFEHEWADTEYSRMFFDVGTGIAGLVVAGVIIVVPVTAPVLVPVELTLMGTQLAVEGGRLVGAYQDYSAAETLVESGTGDYTAMTRYEDVLNAQASTFVLTAGLTVVGAAGSVSSLDDAARALNRADNAGPGLSSAADNLTQGADDVTAGLNDTQRFRPGTFDPEPPGSIVDVDTFRSMTADQQAAHLDSLSESAQVRLSNQLSLPDREALGTARIYRGIVRGVREKPDALQARGLQGNAPTDLTAERVAQMTDDEIRHAVSAGDIRVKPGAKTEWFEEFGDEMVGPYSRVPGADETSEFFDLPEPGYFFPADSTQSQIDDLFRIDVDALSVAEREAVLLQKADALYQGMTPSFAVSGESAQAISEMYIRKYQTEFGRNLDRAELARAGWNNAWGMPPLYIERTSNITAGAGAMESGSTVIGATDSGSTVIGGTNAGGDMFGGGLPSWMYVPAEKVPTGGLPSYLEDMPNSFLPDFLRRPPVRAPAAQNLDSTQIFPNGVFEGGVPPVGTTGLGSSTRAMEQGSSMIHLKPGPWALPPGNRASWRNFMFRAFTIGACQGDWTSDCEKQTTVGVISVPAGKENEVAASLGQDPQVAMVEPNSGRWRQQTIDDPLFSSKGSWQQDFPDQWALQRVGLGGNADQWPKTNADRDTMVIAVIDTGLAWFHPDFALDSLWINKKEIPGNYIDDDLNGYVDDVAGWNFLDYTPVPWDFDGHGTLVASIIAAQTGNGVGVAGINSNVRIMPLKAVNNAGQSRAAYLAEAIVYATNNGARIINISVGGAHLTSAEQQAIDYAISQDILIVAAAGNEGQRLDDYGPAGANGILTVAASDAEDQRMQFSNWGPHVDLMAPGQDVIGMRAPATDLMSTTGIDGYERGANFVGDDQLYYRATGTSFAAPIVAGVASLVWGNDPTLTATDVRRILQQSAQDVGPPGRDQLVGYGLLDAQAALSADPAFFIDVQISGVAVVQDSGNVYLEILGSLDGNQLKSGWLEYGVGTEPNNWKRLSGDLMKPVDEAPLGRIPATELGGEPNWTVRLIGEHANGQRREHRFQVDLN